MANAIGHAWNAHLMPACVRDVVWMRRPKQAGSEQGIPQCMLRIPGSENQDWCKGTGWQQSIQKLALPAVHWEDRLTTLPATIGSSHVKWHKGLECVLITSLRNLSSGYCRAPIFKISWKCGISGFRHFGISVSTWVDHIYFDGILLLTAIPCRIHQISSDL